MTPHAPLAVRPTNQLAPRRMIAVVVGVLALGVPSTGAAQDVRAHVPANAVDGCKPSEVGRWIERARAPLGYCFAKQPYKTMTFVMPFQLRVERGSVTHLAAVAGAKETPLGACLAPHLRRVRFPASMTCDAVVGVILAPTGTLPAKLGRVRGVPTIDATLFGPPASAQPPTGLLVVEFETLAVASPIHQREKAKLKKTFEAKQAELDAEKARVEKLQKQKEELVAKKETVSRLRGQDVIIQQAVEELQTKYQRFQGELATRERVALDKVKASTKNVMREVANEKGASLVLDILQVAWASEEIVCRKHRDGRPTGEDCAPIEAPRVGYLNLKKLLVEHPSAKSAQGQLEAQLGPERKRIEKLKSALKANRTPMAPAVRLKKEQEIATAETAFNAAYAKREGELVSMFFSLIKPQVETLAKEHRIDVLLAGDFLFKLVPNATLDGCADVFLGKKGATCPSFKLDDVFALDAAEARRLAAGDTSKHTDQQRKTLAREMSKTIDKAVDGLGAFEEVPYAAPAHRLEVRAKKALEALRKRRAGR